MNPARANSFPLFLMWSLDPAYRATMPHDFKLTEETKLVVLYGAAGAARHLVADQCEAAP